MFEGDKENDAMLDAFRKGVMTGAIQTGGSGKRHIQSSMLVEMLAIDRERALTTIKAWAEFVGKTSGRLHRI